MSDELSEDDIELAHYQILDLVTRRNFEAALELCRDHIDHWPAGDKHHAFGNLAYVQRRMKNVDTAMTAITSAIQLEPSWVTHWFSRMQLAADIGRFAMAVEDATEIIALEKQRGSTTFIEMAQLYRGYALMQMGRTEEAFSDLSAVRHDGPFHIAGRLWSKSEILEVAQLRK